MANVQSNMNYFPGGFANGLVVRGVPLVQTNPGLVWWVSNNTTLPSSGTSSVTTQRIPLVTGSDNNPGTFSKPFKTLNFAFTQASPGDIIFIKPGHAETVSAANAIVLGKAGVAVIGLGMGNTRPKFTLDTANTASIQVTAEGISVQNLQFVANFLSIATVFSLTTAKNFTVQNCTFTDTSSVLTFLSLVTTDATANHADGLTFVGNTWLGSTNTTATAAITIGAAADSMYVADNTIWLGVNNSGGACVTGAFTPTHVIVKNNTIFRLNTAMSAGLALDTSAVTTGLVLDNRAAIGVDTITQAVWVTNAGAVLSNNRSNLNSQNTVGMLETPIQDV